SFSSAKKAASYAGITPSTWSSGTVTQPRRAITKEGPAPLRLAVRVDGELGRIVSAVSEGVHRGRDDGGRARRVCGP
ncbi:MAG: transposase, partial [Mycolicibacterium sp.]|uniref:transposase n=1 Tax=Mycolicibacterium sp. TaxID=2320850 RepID=UPI003D11316F